MVKTSGNQAPTLSQLEQKDFNEIDDHRFPWMLVLAREELDKFWSSAMLPTFDPPVAVPIGLKFQIGCWFHFSWYFLYLQYFDLWL